jgi:hypothetical protein
MSIPMPGDEVQAGDQLALISERDVVEAARETLIGSA